MIDIFSENDSLFEEQDDYNNDYYNLEKSFDPLKINIETKTPSLDTLISRMYEGEIQMDTENYFQRTDDLWDKVKQSRLIESILIKFPLPAFFFDASNDNNWLIVDGLQRLSSIRNFCIKKNFKLKNLEFLTQLNGLSYDELPGDLKRTIKETQVVIYKIMPGTPIDVKFNIFKRINTGGLVLEPQEIRHALFQGKPADFIKKLSKNEKFLKATKNRIKSNRMQDRDFVNRFLSFYLLGFENYNSDLDTFMSTAMSKINDLNNDALHKIEDDFERSMILNYQIFGDNCFKKDFFNKDSKLALNKALFDALSTQIALLDLNESSKLINNKEIFYNNLKNSILNNVDFYNSISSSTGSKNRVTTRHETIKNIIKNIPT